MNLSSSDQSITKRKHKRSFPQKTLEEISIESEQLIALIREEMKWYSEQDTLVQEVFSQEHPDNETLKERFKRHETEYDLWKEKFERMESLRKHTKEAMKVLKQYFEMISDLHTKFKNSREEIGNKNNEMLEEMEKEEQLLTGTKLNRKHSRLTYNSMKISTELHQQQQEIAKQQQINKKKLSLVDEIISIEQIEELEKECGRKLDFTIFNSDIQKWEKGMSEFDSQMLAQTHFIILIKTTEDKLFGFCCNSSISDINKYIEDENAFLFTFRNNTLKKFEINETSNALKIYSNDNENLFIIGRNDVVIKKQQLKNQCSCHQQSFDYKNLRHILIERRGSFEIGKIVVVGLKLYEEENQRKLLQRLNFSSEEIDNLMDLTEMKCSEILFDSSCDNWSKDLSVLNERIIGKKQLAFIIENDDPAELFGYYEHGTIQNCLNKRIKGDSKSFHFNIQSFGRLRTAKKYEIKNNYNAGYELFNTEENDFIHLGDIHLMKKNNRMYSSIEQRLSYFEYGKDKQALCGKLNYFTPNRIVVIQMN